MGLFLIKQLISAYVRVDSITLQALMVPQELALNATRHLILLNQAWLRNVQSARRTKEAITTNI